jgi:hypothetical protein
MRSQEPIEKRVTVLRKKETKTDKKNRPDPITITVKSRYH